MSTHTRTIVAILVPLAAAAIFLLSRGDPAQEEDPVARDVTDAGSGEGRSDLASVSLALRAARSAADAKKEIVKLESSLRALPIDEAVKLIEAALDGGEDFQLPMGFKIGAGGFLSGHPSWRVALLDLLGKIDPNAAAAYAEIILAEPSQADEWAIALRNYARGNPGEGRAEFLREKTEQLINEAAWRAEPSVGYLESFDVLVHLGGGESTPTLASLVGDRSREGKSVAHAAFLTLDRLTLAEPEKMFEALSQQSELFESRGPMVANFYARADLRVPAQREQVEAYLLDPSRSREDLSAFAGVYPNNNQMISENLLTVPVTAKAEDLIAHDREVLRIVEGWLRDPRFGDPKLKPHLQTMQQRLANFVRQAAGDAAR